MRTKNKKIKLLKNVKKKVLVPQIKKIERSCTEIDKIYTSEITLLKIYSKPHMTYENLAY